MVMHSCNTTKNLSSDSLLVHKNEIIIPQKGSTQEQNAPNRILRTLIQRTEEKALFEWLYGKIDEKVNSSFWTNLRLPPDSTENYFLRELKREDKLFPVQGERLLKYDLANHIIQKPNDSNFRLWLFQTIKENSKSRFWKSVRKNIGTEPQILDSAIIERSVQSMENFLYSEGYLDRNIQYFVRPKNQKATIRYYAYNLKPYYIKSFNINCPDSIMQSILESSETEPFLRAGERIQLRNYDREVLRITNELRNHGYANFSPSYISKLNAAEKKDSMDFDIDIYELSDTSSFSRFYNGRIHIYVDVNESLSPFRDYKSNSLAEMTIFHNQEKTPIKGKSLRRRIEIKPESLFSQKDLDLTKRRLNSMGLYKFVYITSSPDTSDQQKLNYKVFLKSLKKMSLGFDFDLHTARSNSSLNQGRLLFGTTFRTNYRNRNAFRGGEIWNTNLEFGLELAQKTEQTPSNINSFNIRLQNEISFPSLKDWNGSWSLYEKIIRGNENMQEKLDYARNFARSFISVGYDYREQTNFFDENIFSSALGFDYQNENRITKVNQLGLYYYRPTSKALWDSLVLDPNPGYRESFVNQLFTGFLFNQLVLAYFKPANRFGEEYRLSMDLEFSGLEILGVESIYNSITGRRDEFKFLNDISYTKFLKFSSSGSYLRKFGSDRAIGLQLSTGILIPINNNSPYVKQFYAGGANGVRAWQERDLGPGGFIDTTDNSILPYQKADFRLDLMSELRFPIFSYLKGAVFLDAGNVWTIKKDARDNALLTPDFYKQIAIGTGIGFRLDIELAVIRLDIGQKIRLPYENESTGNNWALKNIEDISFRELNYNLALGYPF